MRTSAKLALVAALGMTLAGVTAYAQTDAAAQPSDAPPGGPPPGLPRIAMVLKDLLDKYDTNKDGQLDQTELAALRKDIDDGKIGPPGGAGPRGPGGPGGGPRPPLPKEILDKYDVNKDGKLDETERAALHKDIEAGLVQLPPGAGQHGPRGAGGPGMRPPPTAKDILDKFDVDKDGKLDEAELTAFLKDMRQHRPPPPGGPGGPPPGDAPPPQ
jgi:hypothetical protein